MLGENIWRDLFHGDPTIVGRTIELDKRAFTVVGIMPASFRFPAINMTDQILIPAGA